MWTQQEFAGAPEGCTKVRSVTHKKKDTGHSGLSCGQVPTSICHNQPHVHTNMEMIAHMHFTPEDTGHKQRWRMSQKVLD